MGAIKQVVEFHAELRVDAFGNFRVFDDGKVHVGESRTVEKIARQVAVRPRGWLCESRGVYPLNARLAERMRDSRLGIAD